MRAKAVIAAAAVLAAAAVVVWLGRASGPRGDEGAVRDGTAGAPPAADRPEDAPDAARLQAAKPSSPGAAPSALPPPVDLATRDRDLDLFGVVVTRDGAPVAGADLRAVTYPVRRAMLLDYPNYSRALEGPAMRSASDGTFSLRLRRGERVALRVDAKGLGRFERPGCTAGQRLRVVLEPAVTLVVALKDEAGADVADTDVRVFRADRSTDAAFERRERSDASGRATFSELPPSVWAWIDPDPVRLGKVGWKRVDLPAQGELVVDVVLPKGRTVTGRVSDAATGAPVAGAHVGSNWVQNRAVTTGADGRYEFPGWNEGQGSSDLQATAEGYGRRGFVVGTKEVVDFALERGDSVTGRAVDAAGKPVADVLVGVIAVGSKAGGADGDILGSVRTGTDGRFRTTSLRRDQDHALVLMAPGFGRTLLDFAPRTAGPGEIDVGDVVLPPARAIEGRVLDAKGSGIPDLDVTLKGANADRRRLLSGPADSRGYDGYGQAEGARTDDLGRFRFPDLAPGTYALRSSPQGRVSATRSVSLTAEKDELAADLVFAAGREVTIAVTDSEGRPLAGAQVYVSGAAGAPEGGPTDTKGEVRVTLPPGDWSVTLHWSAEQDPQRRHFRPVSARPIPADASRFVVALEAAGAITGRILDPAGAGVGFLTVEAVRGGEVVATSGTQPDGAFSLDLPAGAAVTVRARGFVRSGADASRGGLHPAGTQGDAWAAEQDRVEVGASGVAITARRLAQDRTVAVQALTPDGRPLAGVGVLLQSALYLLRQGTTDAAGRAAFTGLPPDRWTITVQPDAAHLDEWAPAHVEVEDPSAPVEVRFRLGSPVAGVVEDTEGKPVSRVMVEVLAAGAAAGKASGVRWTDESGRFRVVVDRETAGPLRARVSTPGRTPETFDVPSLPAEDLVLRLTAAPPR